MKREVTSVIDKAHMALDIVDTFENKCGVQIEGIAEELRKASACMANLVNGESATDINFDEEYFDCCREVEALQFQLDFYQKILDYVTQCYIDVLKSDVEGEGGVINAK